MGEPQPYLWEFEPPAGICDFEMTFSFGVYQWLPKASGKGLKKSKGIRITGYTLEPQRAFDKAKELCDRLNTEKVRIDQPPKWLKKSYSASKPEGFEEFACREGIIPDVARRIQHEAMKRMLIPAGFRRGKSMGTYVRCVDDQIHLVNFQGSTGGGQYTVNLGFHYSFIPVFLRMMIKPTEFHEGDCGVTQRIGFFETRPHDHWFDYGADPNVLTASYEHNASNCLSIFDAASKRWKDPRAFLINLPVEQLPDIHPWGWNRGRLFIACVAFHCGDKKRGKSLLADISEGTFASNVKEFYKELLQHYT